jgi:hypothetical protein
MRGFNSYNPGAGKPDPGLTDAQASSAERRSGLIASNEFKIRAIKYNAVQAGVGDDLIVLILDLKDPVARKVYDEMTSAPNYRRLGQDPRPGDEFQLVGSAYSLVRECFSPNHRRVLDLVAATDIRVGVLSEGRTMVAVVPGDRKLEDANRFVAYQTEEDRKAGLSLPESIIRIMANQGD